LRACGEADVAVLAGDAIPAPGWLSQLAACLARDPSIASATPWCNAGEAAGWPRVDPQPPPGDVAAVARAAATMPPTHPELPAAVAHAVLLRGSARAKAGGLDAASYATWYAALTDLSLRMSGLGWRNALCETAFVARLREAVPGDGDMDALAVRWPDWNARIAGFLMEDPLRELRDELGRRLQAQDGEAPQRKLFA
jgi:GT2 family glycosyltransferase